jgi:hypothetical protein
MTGVIREEGSQHLDRRAGVVLWWCSVALWTVLALADAVDYYAGWRLEGHPASFGRALAAAFPGWELWVLLGPLIFLATRHIRLTWPPRLVPMMAHVGLGLAVGVFHTAVHVTAGWYFGIRSSTMSFPAYFQASLFDWLPINLLMYWTVVGTWYGLDYYRRYRHARLEAAELSQQLTEARLDALRSQLHPHFLFNTLNAAVALVRTENGAGAVQVLTQLGEILRHLLSGSGEPEIPLAEELAFLERYLAIEQVRFSNRLSVSVTVPAGLERALVPNLILQPLVENALRHGLAGHDRAGRVSIAAIAEADALRLEVRNDGEPLPAAWNFERSAGVGLANTRARLGHLYGKEGSLTLANGAAAGVVATVIVPLHFASRNLSANGADGD